MKYYVVNNDEDYNLKYVLHREHYIHVTWNFDIFLNFFFFYLRKERVSLSNRTYICLVNPTDSETD